ncbi:hypothetical protein ACKAV7_008274 [Fusarium commune]
MIFEAMTSLLAATCTIEFASRVVGVRSFLPQLSAKRFSTVGGIAEGVFVQQIDSCKSFNDTRWTEHWIALANEHLKHLDNEFEKAELGSSHALLNGLPPSPALISFLGRGAAAMTQTPPGTPIDKDTFPQDGQKGSFIAVNALLEVNGEKDTLISTQDTINLAAWAPNSELLLYPDDDHCAMGHILEWLEYGPCWLEENL